ncbi:hypothetical protein PIROE2DRAFT_6142 [Piromyces sp. E2]|nr:hypothetical protein PIROE2DRAFT_6142 [Piromyces sp. E2]|eukprot:OUM66611.1 hypothetical protein PIROE2DRAFT_6142 [Piromyces sp. E2]
MKLYVFLFFAYICNAYVITNNSNVSNDNSLNKRGGMNSMLCSIGLICEDKPYHDSEFNHYIGFTHDDCSNIKICLPNTRSNYCYTTQDSCPRNGKCNRCPHNGTAYTTCYDSKTNKKTWVFPNVDSYKNPFHSRNNDICRIENNKKRNGITNNIVNRRCLAGNGWCPCIRR